MVEGQREGREKGGRSSFYKKLTQAARNPGLTKQNYSSHLVLPLLSSRSCFQKSLHWELSFQYWLWSVHIQIITPGVIYSCGVVKARTGRELSTEPRWVCRHALRNNAPLLWCSSLSVFNLPSTCKGGSTYFQGLSVGLGNSKSKGNKPRVGEGGKKNTIL